MNDAPIPIIRLWNTLLIPVQGDIGDAQADRLASDVLARIQDQGAAHVVIDLSGVAFLDSHLCMVVAHLAKAARFMGAVTVVTGLTPDIAMTLESMGLNVGTGRTMRSLEDALSSLGIHPHDQDDTTSADDDLVIRAVLGRDARPNSNTDSNTDSPTEQP